MKNILVLLAALMFGAVMNTSAALVTFDENGNGTYEAIVHPLSGIMLRDPGPGGAPAALFYDLHVTPDFLYGDVLIYEGTILSHVLRFNRYDTGFFFYSLQGGPDLADIGLPTQFQSLHISLTEVELEGGANGFIYTPIFSNSPLIIQPGYLWNYGPAGPLTYEFICSRAVPEPSTCLAGALLLLPFGFSAIRHFRSRRQTQMQTLKLKLFTAVAACVLAASVTHAALVVNGGFETGTLAGWHLAGNPAAIAATGIDEFGPHSGYCGAYFAVGGSLGGIVQTVPTVVGQSYIFDFWLQNRRAVPTLSESDWAQEAKVSWAGSVVLSLINPGIFGYTHFTYTVTAIGASTPVDFEFRNAYFILDDVSVVAVPVPEPSTYLAGALLLLPFGFSAIRHFHSRRQAA